MEMVECGHSPLRYQVEREVPERVIPKLHEVRMTHLITGLMATLAALHIQKIKVTVSIKIN
jgi:hypothetical protein